LLRRCQRGTFPGYKEGKLWRVTKDALRQHIKDGGIAREEVNTLPPSKREMTTREAAKIIPGMSEATLQKWLRDAYLMKARPCPFGDAVLSERGEWQYYVWPERLSAYKNAKDLILECPINRTP